jgi:hypothetical protein
MITLTKEDDIRVISAYEIIGDTVVLEWGSFVSFMSLEDFNQYTQS